MIYGWGLGGPGGRKQSQCLPLLPQGPGGGHRHPHLLKGNTDPSQNGKGEGDASPAHTQAPAPPLFSSVKRQGLQATPCSFHHPAQAGTLQDSAAHQLVWEQPEQPRVCMPHEGPCPSVSLHKEAMRGRTAEGPHHSSFPVSPCPSHYGRRQCRTGPVLPMTHRPLPPIATPSHHHHAVGELTLRACPLLSDHFPKDEVGSSFCPSPPSLPPSLPDSSLCC